MAEKIMEVTEVSCSIGKSNPPTLTVHAKGKVTSSGWSNGRLEPVIYVDPPADGIQDFEFVADRPDGMVMQVISPIDAKYSQACDDWVKGVRVHADNNKMECICNAP